MENLGEVPVAVIEKAKTCGGHNLSGAVMRPGPLQELFPDLSREDWRKEGFAFGEVTKEAVYMLPNRKTQAPHPDPAAVQEPRQRGRLRLRAGALPAAPGRGGRRLHPHRDRGDAADRRGRRGRGVRSGDKGRGKEGEPLGQLRARHRHHRPGHRARRGLLGPPHRRRDPRVRPRPRAASRRSGSSASRRSGRSRSRSTG